MRFSFFLSWLVFFCVLRRLCILYNLKDLFLIPVISIVGGVFREARPPECHKEKSLLDCLIEDFLHCQETFLWVNITAISFLQVPGEGRFMTFFLGNSTNLQKVKDTGSQMPYPLDISCSAWLGHLAGSLFPECSTSNWL